MSRKRPIGPWVLLSSAVLIGALWARSFFAGDVLAIFIGNAGRLQAIGSSNGRLCVAFSNIPFGRERSWTAYYLASDHESEALEDFVADLEPSLLTVRPTTPQFLTAAGGAPEYGIFGFSLGTSQPGVVPKLADSEVAYVTLPHWFAVALCGGLGLWMLVSPAARRRRRRASGLCEHCGYDLRASTERCPECGRPIESAGTARQTVRA